MTGAAIDERVSDLEGPLQVLPARTGLSDGNLRPGRLLAAECGNHDGERVSRSRGCVRRSTDGQALSHKRILRGQQVG